MSCHKIILDHITKTTPKRFKENPWGQRHVEAWRNPVNKHERAMRALIVGLGYYCDAHKGRFDSGVADDGYLGPCIWDMLQKVRALLNGEIGRFDGGTLDQLILDIAKEGGFDDDEL